MSVKERLEVYKCSVCGNMVEVIHVGGGELVCCGKPMVLQVANTVDAAKEKHVPVIEKTSAGVLVKIGSVPHPMEEKHYIEWVELLVNEKAYRQFLKPGDKPEALFALAVSGEVTAREYCNLHGLWSAKG
ncbi:MAG: desulfoferrodoxin [Candidatus Saganbacteria bacterium]|nr:desulfoferrodoxin [Candidatus Saganbacteria bacterium]